MPRGRRVAESDNSSKENEQIHSTMAAKKVKAEKKKSGKATQRIDSDDENTRDNSDDEERGNNEDTNAVSGNDEEHNDNGRREDGDDDEESDEEGSPNGKKRARINEGGEAIPVKDEPVKIQRRVTLPRDKDGYVPGSIVRIQLKNFVTYDFVEFRPGPRLNMIFGPNGSGKSTIACAMCIGLNGAPALLGRQNDIYGFVKLGHEEGYVEIELKGKIGTTNLVIRRHITTKPKGSRFTLNGAAVSNRDIDAHLAALNVQVGNLCSFLPQDRVVEFAKMTPQQLLKETQRCAGDEHLTEWHQELIDKGKDLKKIQIAVGDETKRIEQFQERQNSQEKEVKRYKERKEVEKKIKLYEIVLPFCEYRESKEIYDKAKAAKTKAGLAYRRLEEQNRPLKDLQGELNEQHDQLEADRARLKKAVRERYTKAVTAISRRNNQAQSKAEEALDRLKTIKQQEKQRLRDIQRAKDAIAKLEEKVNNPPEFEDTEELDRKRREVNSKGNAVRLQKVDLQGKVQDIMMQVAEKEDAVKRSNHQLAELNNVMNQKLSELSKWDSACAEVARYILNARANGDGFAQRVDLPAVLDVSVNDRNFANAVEACMNANQLKTFVTHSEDDYNHFNRIFIDTGSALNHRVRVTVWHRPYNPDSLMRPPLTNDELREFGFNGYAIDFVQCSEGLKWFLMKELNLHRTPVAADSRLVNDDRVQQAVSRFGPDGRSPPNVNYISGNTMFSVSRSPYGQQKTMTVTRAVRPARNLGHRSVDPNVKKNIEDQIAAVEREINELRNQITAMKDQDQEYVNQLAVFKAESDSYRDRINRSQRIQRDIASQQTTLDNERRKLLQFEKQHDSEDDRKKWSNVVDRSVQERSKLLLEFVELIKNTIKEQSELAAISLRQVQLAAKVEAIDTLCNERNAYTKQIKQNYDKAQADFVTAKADSQNKVNIIGEKLNQVEDELKEEFSEMEKEEKTRPEDERWTSEGVAAILETERTKLELSHATDPGVLVQYETRAREIENLKASLDTKQKKVTKLQQKMQKTRDLWYPALTGLVKDIGAKFSAAFDRIRCAGEVRIAENEDYEKWCIEIWVKFRDTETLAQLTGQRQSGGERALSTILYLMSLVEHARAPFSLVDEINQGMDHHYERMVHDQLVEVTCKPDSGQYFLITPKLLPHLRYHESMKILCVNNGEWLPEATNLGVGNMRMMIDNVISKRRAAAAG
ncbi:hypothetical protein M422DRAFT_23312 [Sphaerobolus stellatus SS14]|nr:hypothetical protein M422DRAFT_23312 [Sphaerobolus stellatus SS14]